MLRNCYKEQSLAYELLRMKRAIVVLLSFMHTPVVADDAAGWENVVSAAKSEGRVVVYNGTTVEVPGRIAKLFEAKYGIAVDLLNGRAGEIRERIRSEQATGKRIGDISLNGIATASVQAVSGAFRPYGYLPNAAKLLPAFASDGTLLQVRAGLFGILMNTSMVSPEDAPKTWAGLALPKWRGRFLLSDPRTAGGGSILYGALFYRFGPELYDKILSQAPVIVTDILVAQRRVARGEYPMYVPFTLADMRNLAGLPVRAIVPEEGAPYTTGAMSILKDAVHPNAARLFLDFYLSDEAQDLYADFGETSATGRVGKNLPAEIRDLYKAKLLGTTKPEDQDAMLARASAAFEARR